VQIEYSLWTRDVEAEILPLCDELGIGFVAYSPLGRGFLTGAVSSLDGLREGDARRRMPRFQNENLARNLQLVRGVEGACRGRALHAGSAGDRLGVVAPALHRADPRHQPCPSPRGKTPPLPGCAYRPTPADALEHIFRAGIAAGARYPAGHLERLMI